MGRINEILDKMDVDQGDDPDDPDAPQESVSEVLEKNVVSPENVTDVIELDNKSSEASSEIIDLEAYAGKNKKVKSANSKCINYECQNGKEMLVAPSFCLSYYRVKVKNTKKQEVCAECLEEAFQFSRKMLTAISEGEYVIEQEFPMRNELVEIIDSDEETTGTEVENEKVYFSKENIEFINENFVEVFNDVLNKYRMEDQINYSVEQLKDKAKKLKGALKIKI